MILGSAQHTFAQAPPPQYWIIIPPDFALSMRDSIGCSGGCVFACAVDTFGRYIVDTSTSHYFEAAFDTMYAHTGGRHMELINYYQIWQGDPYQGQMLVDMHIKVRDGYIPQKDTATISGSTTYVLPAGRVLLLYRIVPSGSTTITVGLTPGGDEIFPATTTSQPLTLQSGITFDTNTTIYITVTGGTSCRHIRLKV